MPKLQKKTLFQIAGILLVILVILLIPSERRKIRKQFNRLADYAQKEPAESVFKGARKASAMSELFTDPCEIKGSIHFLGGTYSRREAAQVVVAARTQFEWLDLSFHDMKIDFPEKRIAAVIVNARMDAGFGGEDVTEVRTLECRMLKEDGKWLFQQCRSIDSRRL